MRDDRPLHVLASRGAVILGLPLLDPPSPNYPSDPALRATRRGDLGHLVIADDGQVCRVWLEFGRGLLGGREYALIVTDGGKLRRSVVEGRTPAIFRERFDAWEHGREAEASIPVNARRV